MISLPILVVLAAGRVSRQAAPSAAPAVTAPAAWMWIWTAGGARPQQTAYFRLAFTVPGRPSRALLDITADDSFRAYLNGGATPVAQGSDWTAVSTADVTAHVVAGRNVIAVEAHNEAGNAGLIFRLRLAYGRRSRAVVVSNSLVRTSSVALLGWTRSTFNDRLWRPSVEIAPANGGAWGVLKGAPRPDPARLVRLWTRRPAGSQGQNPYAGTRRSGDRMILSTSVSSPSDMLQLQSEGFTLFQTDSDHLSTERTGAASWDFRAAERARAIVHAARADWAYFAHEAFPPAWYRSTPGFTGLECLEHHQAIPAFSPWDPAWPKFVQEGYHAMGTDFGRLTTEIGTPGAIICGIHGDYGEAGFMSGARVANDAQRSDWEHRFGNTHDHLGWWCGDANAVADFRKTMVSRYGSVAGLNGAWHTHFADAAAITFPSAPPGSSTQNWLDFVDWYDAAIERAIDVNVSAARTAFPESLLLVPAGFADENPRGGNDNSLIARAAAAHGAGVRSTHGGFHDVALNAATMYGRLASASRFYGAPFWSEPPSGLTTDQEVGRVFEAMSAGASGFFDWSADALRSADVFARYGRFLRVDQPIVDVAMFYPAEAQKLRPDQGYEPLFAQACAYLRDCANFDIVDDRMVDDGCLAKYRVLALWEGTRCTQATLDRIRDWVSAGGTLVAYDFGKVTTFAGDTTWFSELFGYVQQLQPARITERYTGAIPDAYRVDPSSPASSSFLAGDWQAPSGQASDSGRWSGPQSSMRLPVTPGRDFVLVVRAARPDGAGSDCTVRVNGTAVGSMATAGDVTYRFVVSADSIGDAPLVTLEFVGAAATATGRTRGALIEEVDVVQAGSDSSAGVPPLPGALTRELDVHRLRSDWTHHFGRGLLVYFPASRQLLKGYIEVLRRVIYHLSDIDPGRRDAVPIDNETDGVYATLFADGVLLYNPTDAQVTKDVTVPEAVARDWRPEVHLPEQPEWSVPVDAHGLAWIPFDRPPQELLFECEKFTDLHGLRPAQVPGCSPGTGSTAVNLPPGAAIQTRVRVDGGDYRVFVRTLRGRALAPPVVTIDGRPMSAAVETVGDVLGMGSVTLAPGVHTIALSAPRTARLMADFVLLTDDTSVRGYAFLRRATRIE